MANGWLLIVNYGVQWGVESSLIPADRPYIYEDIVKDRENRGFKIEYEKNKVPETQLKMLRLKADSLVERLNHGEIEPDQIEVIMQGKEHKKTKT